MMDLLAMAMTAIGAILLVISALGLFTLRDALTRLHATTKSATLAQGFIFLGVALIMPSFSTAWKVAAILIILFFTLPVSAQMLARAALSRGNYPVYQEDDSGEGSPELSKSE